MPQKEAFITSLRKDFGIDVQAMIRDIHRYLPTFNERKFSDAFYFAAKAHEGQFRKENKPYIIHPVEAVRILISMHADEDTLIAAFLHDVPEDTTRTIEEIETKFGKKVAFLVEGVTKLSKVHFRNDMAERQIESLKKLFIHTAEDPRIILIKLADRLHNMRTLQYIDKPEKRLRIARETLEIFAPIANLLGIEELKAELEDLCFRYIYPDEYENLADRMKRNKEKNQFVLEETAILLQKEFDKMRLKAMVVGRQKNLHSIYKKIVVQGKRLDEVDDLIALRVLVPEREDCYKVLGLLHSLFKPKPGMFKDYIAVPKANGYQSLHTTVFGLQGMVTEFQIRTHQMHLEAEYGIAAHYFYDQQRKDLHQIEKDRRSSWVNTILHMQKEQLENNDFIEDLKLDVFQDRIFVFTPKGDPVDLPKGATCIDFAYNIHTQVGHRALKANVQGEIVPMTTALKMGDTVRVITSDKPKGPSLDWLSFAKTNLARNKIREYLKHESEDAKIRTGNRLLQKEFDRAGLGLVKNIPQKKIRTLLKHFSSRGYGNFDDVMVALGEGTLNSLELLKTLYPAKTTKTPDKTVDNEQKPNGNIQVTVKIVSEDRMGQLKKFLQIAADLGLNIVKTKAYISFWKSEFVCKFIFKVQNFGQLSQFFESIEHIDGVHRVERLFWRRKVAFVVASALTFCVWAAHPLILYLISRGPLVQSNPLLASLFLYCSLFLLFFMVFLLKRLTQRSFPELRETNALWLIIFVLSIFALITFFAELFFLQLQFSWIITGGIILIIFSYLTIEYIEYRNHLL